MRRVGRAGLLDPKSIAPLISDVDGDEFAIASVTPGTHGAVIFNGTRLTFGPADASFTGNDVFTYTINDGRGGAATASITLQNALPIASTGSVHPSTGLVRLDVLQLGTPDVDPEWRCPVDYRGENGTHGTASTRTA